MSRKVIKSVRTGQAEQLLLLGIPFTLVATVVKRNPNYTWRVLNGITLSRKLLEEVDEFIARFKEIKEKMERKIDS